MRHLIAVHVAMKQEGIGFAQTLGLEESAPLDADLGFREFAGTFGNTLDVRLFLQGTDARFDAEQVGLEAAAVCSALYIQKYRPALILNFGTAGAFSSSGLAIGEVVAVRGPVRFHDRRVPIPGYFESQEGSHGVAKIDGLVAALGVKTALVSSGSSLEMSTRDEEILKGHGADLKEMEAAAIAWIAERKSIPLVALKSVTDLIDLPEKVQDQFLANLAAASRNVQAAAIRALEYLDAHPEDAVWKTR